MVDYNALATEHLESALSKGYITLLDGTELHLTAPQVLMVAKYVLKEGLLSTSESASEALSMPTEMFTPLTPLTPLTPPERSLCGL